MASAIEIFCCYAREDEPLLEELKSHLISLQHQGRITLWTDVNISPGEDWEQAINQHLDSAQVIILLISPNFMSSDYCYSKELKRAMERNDQGEAHVIPILLRPVLWQGTNFAKLQLLPKNARPIKSSGWFSTDEAFVSVAKEISALIERLLNPPPTDKEAEDENNADEVPTIFQNDAILTGFEDLDRITGGGFHRSDLIIIGAPATTGKTSFALNITLHAAIKQKCAIGIFSLKMKKDRLNARLIAIDAAVECQNLMNETLDDEEWEHVVFAIQNINEANIWIDDSHTITFTELQKQAQRMVKEYNISLIIIDYIDFIQSDDHQASTDQRDHNMSRSLKLLARELDVPIVALTQKPHLKRRSLFSNLVKEVPNAAIDDFADIVLFLYREDMYEEYCERRGIMDILVTKNRHGLVGQVSIYCQPVTKHMRDLEHTPPDDVSDSSQVSLP